MEAILHGRSPEKRKQLLIAGGALILGCIGLMVYNHGISPASQNWLSLLGVASGGLGAFLCWQSVKNRAIVRLDESGFSARAIGNATVGWKHIQRFEWKQVGGQKFLVVKVSHPDSLLREMNHAVRALMKANMKTGTHPILVPASDFPSALEPVVAEMETFRKNRK